MDKSKPSTTVRRAKQLQDRLVLPGTPVRVQNGGSQDGKGATAKPSNSKSKSKCAVCLDGIVDGRDEAIFCEGQCKMWYHRGCASVSQKLLSSLTASDEPFLCLMCSRAQFQQEVTELRAVIDALKDKLQVIPELRADIDTMKKKIEEIPILQQKVTTISEELSAIRQNMKTSPPSTSQAAKRSYAERAASNSGPKRRNYYKPSNFKAANATPASVTTNTARPTSANANVQKVKVLGARRIWGTLKSATASTVSSTLKKLSTSGNKLTVRRKFKTNEISGRIHWWFILKGSESDLEELERDWDHVQLQTGWKLENCYMSPLSSPNPELSGKQDETSAPSLENNPDLDTNDNNLVVTNSESPAPTGCTNIVTQSPFLDNPVPKHPPPLNPPQ